MLVDDGSFAQWDDRFRRNAEGAARPRGCPVHVRLRTTGLAGAAAVNSTTLSVQKALLPGYQWQTITGFSATGSNIGSKHMERHKTINWWKPATAPFLPEVLGCFVIGHLGQNT
jgi:hypothetical protein